MKIMINYCNYGDDDHTNNNKEKDGDKKETD